MKIVTKYLLHATLDELHFKCQEWIDLVEFYIIELGFLNDLISDKIDTTTPEDLDHKEVYGNIDALLYKLSEELLTSLFLHKNVLNRLILNKEPHKLLSYRKDHIKLYHKIKALKSGVKDLKKSLFKYLKDNPFSFDFELFIQNL